MLSFINNIKLRNLEPLGRVAFLLDITRKTG